jgi:STE24 endopeptidase
LTVIITGILDHPSVENRIRMAMEWKAKHPAEAPAAVAARPTP